jgi:hypothetical protein
MLDHYGALASRSRSNPQKLESALVSDAEVTET